MKYNFANQAFLDASLMAEVERHVQWLLTLYKDPPPQEVIDELIRDATNLIILGRQLRAAEQWATSQCSPEVKTPEEEPAAGQWTKSHSPFGPQHQQQKELQRDSIGSLFSQQEASETMDLIDLSWEDEEPSAIFFQSQASETMNIIDFPSEDEQSVGPIAGGLETRQNTTSLYYTPAPAPENQEEESDGTSSPWQREHPEEVAIGTPFQWQHKDADNGTVYSTCTAPAEELAAGHCSTSHCPTEIQSLAEEPATGQCATSHCPMGERSPVKEPATGQCAPDHCPLEETSLTEEPLVGECAVGHYPIDPQDPAEEPAAGEWTQGHYLSRPKDPVEEPAGGECTSRDYPSCPKDLPEEPAVGECTSWHSPTNPKDLAEGPATGQCIPSYCSTVERSPVEELAAGQCAPTHCPNGLMDPAEELISGQSTTGLCPPQPEDHIKQKCRPWTRAPQVSGHYRWEVWPWQKHRMRDSLQPPRPRAGWSLEVARLLRPRPVKDLVPG